MTLKAYIKVHDPFQPGVVVVLGLSPETSEREVVEYLHNFCPVRHCAIKSKGPSNFFAFVEFASLDGVHTVLHHAPHMIGLRPVRVVRAFKQVRVPDHPFPGMAPLCNPVHEAKLHEVALAQACHLDGPFFDPPTPHFSLFASASPLFAR